MAVDNSRHIDTVTLESRPPVYHAWTGAIFGLFFPLGAWIIDSYLKQHGFSVQGLVDMHLTNPIHFIIDTAPVVLFILSYYFAQSNQNRIQTLSKIIEQKSEDIQRNVELAKKIGSNESDIAFSEITNQDALGESLLLMHKNLQENAQKEYEQNWMAKGKEYISVALTKFTDISDLTYQTLVRLTTYTNTIQGAFYLYDDDKDILENIATYAYNRRKYPMQRIQIGEGLIGQAAYEKAPIYRREIPQDYMTITSGILGHRKPSSLVIVPLISDEKLQGIIELASLNDSISDLTRKFLDELSSIVAQTIFNLKANRRTTELLEESRKMTIELQNREEILKKNAEDMKRASAELALSNKNLETQIQEVERGQKRLYSLLENASEVISIYDESGIVKYESPSARSILGYDPEKTIDKNAFQIQTSILHSLTYDKYKKLLSEPNASHTYELSYTKPSGEQMWLEAVGRNLIDNAAIAGILFNTRDITVRKIAEQAQRMSGEMQALSENSVDIIIRLSLDGTFYYVNPIIKDYTGIDKNELIKNKLENAELPENVNKVLEETMQKILEEPVKQDAEFNFKDADNKKHIMQLNAIPEFNEDKLETVLFVIHDITEQKAIEMEIKEKNKAISDSINYAQRIQSAIIPDTKIMRDFFPESFIFYSPKDIVSGDFPWLFVKSSETIYIAAVDCTGHGVPGALLSFVGYFLLNNIVDHDIDYTAGQVLDLLHKGVQKTLRQDKEGANARDGMDMALVKIEQQKKQLQFSGAHRPLYFLREGKITEYRGNKKSIGGIPTRRGKKEEKDFQNYVIDYLSGDRLFIFSDGLPDQVGGPRNRKYQAVRMREKIVETQPIGMHQVLQGFTSDFDDWKGENKQIDDVLLIGIEL